MTPLQSQSFPPKVKSTGDVAITGYSVLARKSPVVLLQCRLYTGKTHQIRAHLSHIGHPLLGDGKYGVNRADRAKGYKFQALYAYRLQFRFRDGTGPLGYLNGKTVQLDPAKIWFLREFGM